MPGFTENFNNLPPGVSGNEPEIADDDDFGDDKTDVCLYCGGPSGGMDFCSEECADEWFREDD